ncbi:MAG: hypothetical protein JO320_18895 [Alphaproteobacteria bacterium]|nr:hypothetical protein [Alphaproteobacteria bacterium]
MAAADLDQLGSMLLNYSRAGYGRNEHYWAAGGPEQRRRSGKPADH